jgi:hypothetical protein
MRKLKRLRWPQYSLARSSPWPQAVLRGPPDAWLSSACWGVRVAVPLFKRGALAIAAVSLAASSSSCVLTADLPNLSLDVPQRYKAAELSIPDGATPKLDWWRGFRWNFWFSPIAWAEVHGQSRGVDPWGGPIAYRPIFMCAI